MKRFTNHKFVVYGIANFIEFYFSIYTDNNLKYTCTYM